jgi:hypothetical protein
MSLRTRPLRPDDDRDIRRVFRATLAMGHPAPLGPGVDRALRPYERLCLDWYLDGGRDVACVLTSGGDVVGYALVCLHPAAFARWQRRAGARFAAYVMPRLLARRYPAPIDRFYRLRLRDGWAMWRHHNDRLDGVPHAHLNACDTMGGLPGRLLADHVDATVAAAGFPAWYGEINARSGRRVAALGRWGAQIVDRQPNLTLTWLAGAPVERLTILRSVDRRRIAA